MTILDLRQSIINYVQKTQCFPDMPEILNCLDGAEDIKILKEQFKEKYNLEIPDIFVEIIWNWHSGEFNAGWLIVSKNRSSLLPDNMVFFDEFFEKFLKSKR